MEIIFFNPIMANPCSFRTPGTLRLTLNFTPMLLNHWASVLSLVGKGHTASGLVIGLIKTSPSWNFFPLPSWGGCGEILWPINGFYSLQITTVSYIWFISKPLKVRNCFIFSVNYFWHAFSATFCLGLDTFRTRKISLPTACLVYRWGD